MQVKIIGSLEEVLPEQWNALAGDVNPFVRHEFLVALERHGCVGDQFGWWPQHVTAFDGDKLVGAMPMYLKNNSYGEFVFDWGWADAYERAGLDYYPKLVVAVPYTPVTGPRLMVANETVDDVRELLVGGALSLAEKLEVSSLHLLFTTESDTAFLEQHQLMRRVGCQFHWHNQSYSDFDDFLSTFSSQKRKKVKRERRHVKDAGVKIELLHGHEITDNQWKIFHHFYCSTFYRRSGYPTLSLEFFKELGKTMPDNVVLILASYQGNYVAGAFNMRGTDTLHGRHWGCSETFHSLHFELCYYRAIDYCIDNGLARFEAGAQGEHKLSRGFVPTPTFSAHWLSHPDFKYAIEDFLQREKGGMEHYMDVMNEHLPYKKAGPYE